MHLRELVTARETAPLGSQVIAPTLCKPRVCAEPAAAAKLACPPGLVQQETPAEASPAAALDEAALLLKSFTRDEAELGARAPLPQLDGYVFVLFIAAQLALNWALRLIIARPLANFLLATPDRPTRAFRRMVVKFSQACLELLVYGSFALIGLVIVPSQPWFWPSKHWWIGFADGGHEVVAMTRCAYGDMLPVLSMCLEPRKDFVEMLLHRRYCSRGNLAPRLEPSGCVACLLDPPMSSTSRRCSSTSDARESRDVFAPEHVYAAAAFRATAGFLVTRIAMYPRAGAHVEATLLPRVCRNDLRFTVDVAGQCTGSI